MTHEPNVVLTLVDSSDIYTDELGLPKVGDDEELLRSTQEVLSLLQAQLGSPEIVLADRRRSGQGRAFGGMDIITEVTNFIFPVGHVLVGTAPLFIGLIPIIKKFIELKMDRRDAVVEIGTGKAKIIIKLKNITEQELQKLFDTLKELSEKPTKPPSSSAS